MSDSRAVVFGEQMLRLDTKRFERFLQAKEFDIGFTGAETNSAISLVNYGVGCDVVSAVPDHELGQACINHLRRYGLNTNHIQRCGNRLGILYVESGASQRASKVIYDREHSAIRELSPGDIPWDEIFEGKEWFHFSGTAPALSDNVADVVNEACQSAKRHGVTISCDLNYRKKLWNKKEAQKVMTDLMQWIDVLIGNEEDADNVFGIQAEGVDVTSGELNSTSYQSVAKQLLAKFDLQLVATTLRESLSASDNNWSGLLYDGKDFYQSRQYSIRIVDRIGAGDAFSGGLIYGMLSDWPLQKTVDFAVAASCLKHSIHGDFNLVSVPEVNALVEGNESGRVQR